jgi:hypothetical protein
MIRYADNFLAMGRGGWGTAGSAARQLDTTLDALGLPINHDKTHIGFARKGFEFVGYRFECRDGQVNVTPGPKQYRGIDRIIHRQWAAEKYGWQTPKRPGELVREVREGLAKHEGQFRAAGIDSTPLRQYARTEIYKLKMELGWGRMFIWL